jgi:hypothetical protein
VYEQARQPVILRVSIVDLSVDWLGLKNRLIVDLDVAINQQT